MWVCFDEDVVKDVKDGVPSSPSLMSPSYSIPVGRPCQCRCGSTAASSSSYSQSHPIHYIAWRIKENDDEKQDVNNFVGTAQATRSMSPHISTEMKEERSTAATPIDINSNVDSISVATTDHPSSHLSDTGPDAGIDINIDMSIDPSMQSPVLAPLPVELLEQSPPRGKAVALTLTAAAGLVVSPITPKHTRNHILEPNDEFRLDSALPLPSLAPTSSTAMVSPFASRSSSTFSSPLTPIVPLPSLHSHMNRATPTPPPAPIPFILPESSSTVPANAEPAAADVEVKPAEAPDSPHVDRYADVGLAESVVPPPDFQLGFSSGLGRRLEVSADRLKAAQKKFESEDAKYEANVGMEVDDEDNLYKTDLPPVAPPQSSEPFLGFGKCSIGGKFIPHQFKPESLAEAAKRIERDQQEADESMKDGDSSNESHSSPSAVASLTSVGPSDSHHSPFLGFGKFTGGQFVQAKTNPETMARAAKFIDQPDHKADHRMAADEAKSSNERSDSTISSTVADAGDSFVGFGFAGAGGKFVPAVFKAESLARAAKFLDEDEQLDQPHEAIGDDSTISNDATEHDHQHDSFTTPASKKRKTSFSTALPMPMDDEEEAFSPTPVEMKSAPVRLNHSSVSSLASTKPPLQPRVIGPTLISPPPPPPPPSKATTPAPAAASSRLSNAVHTPVGRAPNTAAHPASTSSINRKRPFISPRVAIKPAAPAVTPTPAPNLLTVNKRNNPTPDVTTHSSPSPNQSSVPSLGVAVSLPPSAASSSSKMNLRRFAAVCRAKVEASLLDMPPPLQPWPQHTSILVEYITSANATLVKFIRPDHSARVDGLESPFELGWLDARTSLLALGLSSSLCSIPWVRNHYRWVVWKLASYQRRFASALDQPPCTFEKVVQQLYKRYEREINQVKIPCLRKIVEGDEAPGKFLILMVAQVVGSKVPPSTVSGAPTCATWVDNVSGAIPTRPGACELELSDGWYSVWCKLDQGLFHQLQQGKIYPGQKLRVWGAQLAGSMPTTPLENSETYMKM